MRHARTARRMKQIPTKVTAAAKKNNHEDIDSIIDFVHEKGFMLSDFVLHVLDLVKVENNSRLQEALDGWTQQQQNGYMNELRRNVEAMADLGEFQDPSVDICLYAHLLQKKIKQLNNSDNHEGD